jgi:hypothetical protein
LLQVVRFNQTAMLASVPTVVGDLPDADQAALSGAVGPSGRMTQEGRCQRHRAGGDLHVDGAVVDSEELWDEVRRAVGDRAGGVAYGCYPVRCSEWARRSGAHS